MIFQFCAPCINAGIARTAGKRYQNQLEKSQAVVLAAIAALAERQNAPNYYYVPQGQQPQGYFSPNDPLPEKQPLPDYEETPFDDKDEEAYYYVQEQLKISKIQQPFSV